MSHTHRRPARPHDWAFLGVAAAAVAAGAALLGSRPGLATASVVAAGLAALAGRLASRRRPGPMPYTLRWVLYMPRLWLSPAHVLCLLAPRAGERIVEIGPGIGVYSIPIAAALARGGVLDVLDVQAEMLAAVARRAARHGVTNVVTTRGDAQHLPYPDVLFHAACLIGVLGEIPDPAAALREVRRVLRPDGRLVVGEAIPDPDWVRLPHLRRLAAEAGFVLEERRGPRIAYLARLRPAASVAPPRRGV